LTDTDFCFVKEFGCQLVSTKSVDNDTATFNTVDGFEANIVKNNDKFFMNINKDNIKSYYIEVDIIEDSPELINVITQPYIRQKNNTDMCMYINGIKLSDKLDRLPDTLDENYDYIIVPDLSYIYNIKDDLYYQGLKLENFQPQIITNILDYTFNDKEVFSAKIHNDLFIINTYKQQVEIELRFETCDGKTQCFYSTYDVFEYDGNNFVTNDIMYISDVYKVKKNTINLDNPVTYKLIKSSSV
jgi:hypothetical protein